MRLRRLYVRVAAVLPVAAIAACSDQDVSNAISDWIKAALWFMAKMILISMALMFAFALAAVLGGGLIFLGVRRRKLDVATVLSVLAGVGLIVGAWPMVFSQDGLAGVIAPGSTSAASAGPVVGQALAILAAVIVTIVFLKRRDAKKRAAAPPPASADVVIPAPPPPLPSFPPPVIEAAPVVESRPVAKAKASNGARRAPIKAARKPGTGPARKKSAAASRSGKR